MLLLVCVMYDVCLCNYHNFYVSKNKLCFVCVSVYFHMYDGSCSVCSCDLFHIQLSCDMCFGSANLDVCTHVNTDLASM
jgi:hypothetical protein